MGYSKQFISLMTSKLKKHLIGNRLFKIIAFNQTDVFFSLSQNKADKLFISLNAESPFVSITSYDLIAPSIPTPFFMMLKSHLLDAKVESVEQIPDERIIKFILSTVDDAYHTHKYNLFLELFPKHPNLVLTDEEHKIIALYRSTELTSKRSLMRGLTYTLPDILSRNSELGMFSKDEIYELYYLHDNVGFDIENLKKVFLENEKLYFTPLNHYSIMPLTHLGESKVISLQDLFDHYLESATIARRQFKFNDLLHFIEQKIKILERKLKNFADDANKAEKKMAGLDYGNLLLTYIDSLTIEPTTTFLELDGLKINIDPTLSVADNAQVYFKAYRKAKLTLSSLQVQTKLTEDELNYFALLNQQAKNADEEDLEEIRRELVLEGYIKPISVKNKPKAPKTNKISPHFVSYQDIKIGYGKNNLQNDELTFGRATANSIFLHVKNYPGAHVIIFHENPSKDVLTLAGEIALISCGLESGEIDVARKKNVKKTSMRGLVILKEYQTIFLKEIHPATYELMKIAIRK